MMDELISIVGGMVGAIATILALSNRVNDRFAKIEIAIERLRGEVELERQTTADLAEKVEYYQETSEQQVAHARNRMQQEIDRVNQSLSIDLERLSAMQKNISNFLAKTTSFEPRS